MFPHVTDLQLGGRISRPDPRVARLLFDQFGGGNGERKAAAPCFVQASAGRHYYPAFPSAHQAADEA